MMEACVTTQIECAHRDALTGGVHGHSYTIETWFEAGPHLVMTHLAVKTITDLIDHTMLDDSVGGPQMEDIAKWVLPRVSLLAALDVTRVVVRRPSLGFAVQITPEPAPQDARDAEGG
jgi:6-pyruvoyl-tetrahydropterin synthase